MANETSKTMYCSDCKGATEHVKLSMMDLQGIRSAYDEYLRNHPEATGSDFYKSLPDWYKNVSIGFDGTVSNIANGISNYFLGKDYRSLWICSNCKRPQIRMFE